MDDVWKPRVRKFPELYIGFRSMTLKANVRDDIEHKISNVSDKPKNNLRFITPPLVKDSRVLAGNPKARDHSHGGHCAG